MSANSFQSAEPKRPDISFAIACFNSQPFLCEAVQSALAQTGVDVEVLIVDDGSSDDSLCAARRMAEQDPRVRVFQTPMNGGPSAARNIAIHEMQGDWFAILDSDDWIEPNRSRLLIDIANETSSDLIADNLRVFGEDIEPHNHFSNGEFSGGRRMQLDEYLDRSRLFGKSPGPGFLKPIIRKHLINRFAIRYNSDLRVGEDDELIVRLLNHGAIYYVIDKSLYHYRKHGSSISHRLSLAHAEKMLRAEHNIRAMLGPKAHSASYRKRWRALKNGVAFCRAIDAIKDRQWGKAVTVCALNPKMLPLFAMPLKAAYHRLFGGD